MRQNPSMPVRALRQKCPPPFTTRTGFSQNPSMPVRALRLNSGSSKVHTPFICQNPSMPVRALRPRHRIPICRPAGRSESINARQGIKTHITQYFFAPLFVGQNPSMPVRALRRIPRHIQLGVSLSSESINARQGIKTHGFLLLSWTNRLRSESINARQGIKTDIILPLFWLKWPRQNPSMPVRALRPFLFPLFLHDLPLLGQNPSMPVRALRLKKACSTSSMVASSESINARQGIKTK